MKTSTNTDKAKGSKTKAKAAKSEGAPAKPRKLKGTGSQKKAPAAAKTAPSVSEIFQNMSYGPAPESEGEGQSWLEGHKRRFGHYVDGAWRKPAKAAYFEVENPGRGNPLAEVAQGSDADVDRAVSAAKAALPAWQALGGHGRARYLYAIARALQRHSRELSVIESLDNGKSIRESRDIDIPLVARHFYHHAGWAQVMARELPDQSALGVIGQIIPWNFPLLMLAWKVAPALAMGNTVVLKPAEYTPLSAARFADLIDEIGLPPGVVNVVNGDGATGAALVAHEGVQKIAFTGSTEVGRIIRKATAGTGKKLSLELGGKSPFIVYEDADLDGVVEGVVDAIWFNQGQVCCAGSRILVQESVATRLEEKLRARMNNLRVGDPMDKCIDMGAIVAKSQLEQISRAVEVGVEEGATCWQAPMAESEGGHYFPPTLLTGVSPASTVAQEEIFGPVVVMMSFRTPAESVKLANNSRYGLAGSIWSENINLALEIAPKIKAGIIWINCSNVFDAAAGFGGVRESGFGREGGKEGLYEYLKSSWKTAKAVESPNGDASLESRAAKGPKAKKSAKAKGLPEVDQTSKLFIGGKQRRPDGAYSLKVLSADGATMGEVGRGSRKDIRDAVEAAHAASGWSKASAHNRAQILYYMAENLSRRQDETIGRLATMIGDKEEAKSRYELSVQRLFTYAAMADKYDGAIHATPGRQVTLAMNEPVGVIGIVCPDSHPLLGFISTIAPALAMGNALVVLASERHPLAATDFYQILETSDLPSGALNIVTGLRAELLKPLCGHADVDHVWHFGNRDDNRTVELESAFNMKRTWCQYGRARDWAVEAEGADTEFLRQACSVKNIWIPYGD